MKEVKAAFEGEVLFGLKGCSVMFSFFITEGFKVLVFEFSPIISSNLFDFYIILIFNIPDKGHYGFSCLDFLGEEVNPSVS